MKAFLWIFAATLVRECTADIEMQDVYLAAASDSGSPIKPPYRATVLTTPGSDGPTPYFCISAMGTVGSAGGDDLGITVQHRACSSTALFPTPGDTHCSDWTNTSRALTAAFAPRETNATSVAYFVEFESDAHDRYYAAAATLGEEARDAVCPPAGASAVASRRGKANLARGAAAAAAATATAAVAAPAAHPAVVTREADKPNSQWMVGEVLAAPWNGNPNFRYVLIGESGEKESFFWCASTLGATPAVVGDVDYCVTFNNATQVCTPGPHGIKLGSTPVLSVSPVYDAGNGFVDVTFRARGSAMPVFPFLFFSSTYDESVSGPGPRGDSYCTGYVKV